MPGVFGQSLIRRGLSVVPKVALFAWLVVVSGNERVMLVALGLWPDSGQAGKLGFVCFCEMRSCWGFTFNLAFCFD